MSKNTSKNCLNVLYNEAIAMIDCSQVYLNIKTDHLFIYSSHIWPLHGVIFDLYLFREERIHGFLIIED